MDSIFCLKCIKVLQDLSDEELQEMFGSVTEKEFSQDELIYTPAESAGKIFFVRDGEVDIYQKSTGGKKFVTNTLQAGDMFGDIQMTTKTNTGSENFARASKKTRVCLVDKLEFMNYLQKKPELAMRIIEDLSQRLTQVESKVRDLALNNVQIRLLNELHRLGVQFGEENDNETTIKKKFTHEELAERISATRETVTKVIGDLETKGFIRYDKDRHIVICRDKLDTTL
jgi:CRP-like cAMP-binding protein